MIALFFEVLPRPGEDTTYLDMAARLKPALDASGGVAFLDRSRSADRPGWYLSHQIWQDEAAMTRWRLDPAHRRAQACGRADILADYRLRVGAVIGEARGDGAVVATGPTPADGAGRYLLSVLADGAIDGLPGEVFASVYDEALRVHVVPARDAEDGMATLQRLAGAPNLRQARLCRIERDYGMFERAEVPADIAVPVGCA